MLENIEIIPKIEINSKEILALVYTPSVAKSSLEIKDNMLVLTIPDVEFEDIIIEVKMSENIRTSTEGISVSGTEKIRSYIADIEIMEIQKKRKK